MRSVVKLCAAQLRAISNNHGVKLKSSHAHELVASFFGYKSKASMLADGRSPISNLAQVKMFVLMPSLFINERIKCLDGLPANLPSTYVLGEEMFVRLVAEEGLTFRTFATLGCLASVVVTEYLSSHGRLIFPQNFLLTEKASSIFSKPFYEFKPKIQVEGCAVKLIVANRYHGSELVNFQSIDVLVEIRLQRIAGYVGYGLPEVFILDVSSGNSDYEFFHGETLNHSGDKESMRNE